MSRLVFLFLMIMSLSAGAQSGHFKVFKDSVDGGQVFNGPVTFSDLNKEASFTWLSSGYDLYDPDGKTIEKLQGRLKNYSIVVFLGTWCDDSHNLVPKLEKVLDKAAYPYSNLTMYGVDRGKTTLNGEDKQYGIKLVPTIILINEGKEVGRITESVSKSIEDDLEAIIEKDALQNK